MTEYSMFEIVDQLLLINRNNRGTITEWDQTTKEEKQIFEIWDYQKIGFWFTIWNFLSLSVAYYEHWYKSNIICIRIRSMEFFPSFFFFVLPQRIGMTVPVFSVSFSHQFVDRMKKHTRFFQSNSFISIGRCSIVWEKKNHGMINRLLY